MIDLNPFAPGLGAVTAEAWDIGTGINAYVWQAPEARAAILFIHGYSDYAFRWVNQCSQFIPRLLSMGITVYAVDARGHGYTAGTKGLIDVEQAVADHLAARRFLKEQPLPVFVMGHSLGGLITASSIAKTQEGIAGIIVMSGALYYSQNNIFTRLATQSVAAFAPKSILIPGESRDSVLYRGAQNDPVVQNDKIIYRGDVPVKTLSSTLKMTKQNPGLYKRITIPALIIHGTEDKVTEIKGSQLMFDAIGSSDKTFERIEGGYHSLLDDEKKDEVLYLILSWIEKRI
jgi:acylglycerol lipase